MKTREYCEHAIPFILGYEDPDFPATFRYAVRFPPDDTPVDLFKVLDFIQSLKVDQNVHRKIRSYAEARLDWSKKMAPVVDELTNLLPSQV